MRALLDNSTLTAAFRAIGLIPNPNRDLFDLDVSALRVLIDNLIISDEIYILDDYKPEFSEERKAWLPYDFVSFESIPEPLSNRMLKHARAHVHNWHLGQHLATDFAELFNDMAILFRHAWRGSESFLVLKAFGVENKYNNTVTRSLIQFLPKSGDESQNLREFSPKAYNRATVGLAKAVAWSAIRTVYYRQAGKLLGCDYMPHPLRNMYNAKCILYDNHPNTRKIKLHSAQLPPERDRRYEEYIRERNYLNDMNGFFRRFWQSCNEKDDNVFGIQTFDVEMPPFLSYVLRQYEHSMFGGGGENIINMALELRESEGPKRLRELLKYIYVDCKDIDRPSALRAFAAELRGLKERLQVYLGYQRERINLSAKVVSYNFSVPRFMTKPFYPYKPHLAFIRDVILELASVEAMGRLTDFLWTRTHGKHGLP
ncbi:MAG: hypothetical protein HY913_14690 [Desulfomonile tiedjei]|nr:hypothetical protein [Desulfomonile tiedjei]